MKYTNSRKPLFKKRTPIQNNHKSKHGEIRYKATYSLPKRFEVDMVWNGTSVECRWTPDIPNKQTINRKLLKAYTLARDDFYTDVATIEDRTLAVVDLMSQKITEITPSTNN